MNHSRCPAPQVWEGPSTEKPVLEPLFAAGFHGIELAFLLLAEFVSDSRRCEGRAPALAPPCRGLCGPCNTWPVLGVALTRRACCADQRAKGATCRAAAAAMCLQVCG